jgi:hypothetical protein
MRPWGILYLSLGVVGAALAARPAAAVCPPPAEQARAIEAPGDGTIRLSDGRILKLAGVELTPEGRSALPALVRGRSLTIRAVGRPDRWGRLPAHIDGVEEMLLAQGLAHAAAQTDGACLAPLLTTERKAREARAGIWSTPGHVLDARDGAALTERLGQHVLAIGRVESARLHRGRVYLNFARYWKSGLSLIIAENNWPMFAGGAAPESLAGKRVRARGRLEWQFGPAILAGPDDRIEIE